MSDNRTYSDSSVDYGDIIQLYDGEYTDISISPSAITLTITVKDVTYRSSVSVEGGALTLTLWNPNIRLDSSVSPASLSLVSSLQNPTYRSDGNVYPVVQTLISSLKNPFVRLDSTFTTTVLELIATLNDPTLSWSSSVSPSSLSLIATLNDGVPFLITRIIRKNYWFGVTEQVTHTKLNNFMDTAIWEISNQVAGDMVTYDSTQPAGSRWVRIAKGSNAQVMKMVDGMPAWANA